MSSTTSLIRSTLRHGEALGRRLPVPPGLKHAAKLWLIRRAFADTDAFIASYPKAGRTWLRFILANYLNGACELGLTIDLGSMFWLIPNHSLDEVRGRRAYRFDHRPDVPLLVATHEPHRRALFAAKPVVFMVREPKDLLVSAYFHRARSGSGYLGDIGTYLRDPALGLAEFLRYTNGWAAHLGEHRHLVVAYEQLRADTPGIAEAVLRFLGLPPDPDALAAALAASSFEAMRATEARQGIPGRAYRVGDPDSLRVRKGKVGGFAEHLVQADIAFVDRGCREGLSPAAKALMAGVGLAIA